MDSEFYKDVVRYMGVKHSIYEQSLESLVKEAQERVTRCARPRYVSAQHSLTLSDDNTVTYYAGVCVPSIDLVRHLKGCCRMVLFAATLGLEVDRLIERDVQLRPSLAMAEQAVATVMIERYSDECCAEIQSSLGHSLYLTPRFSPGYGDCDLTNQEALLNVLDAHKRIGLSMTDSFMMVPIKSISGWLGITSEPSDCFAKGCAMCNRKRCSFRKVENAL